MVLGLNTLNYCPHLMKGIYVNMENKMSVDLCKNVYV